MLQLSPAGPKSDALSISHSERGGAVTPYDNRQAYVYHVKNMQHLHLYWCYNTLYASHMNFSSLSSEQNQVQNALHAILCYVRSWMIYNNHLPVHIFQDWKQSKPQMLVQH